MGKLPEEEHGIVECTPKVRHENKGPITLNGESNADAPTTIFSRYEGCHDAGDRLRKEYGGGSPYVSGQPQTAGNVEKRVAGEGRTGVSGNNPWEPSAMATPAL